MSQPWGNECTGLPLSVEGVLCLSFLIWKVWIMAVALMSPLGIQGVDARKALRTAISFLARRKHSVNIG